MPKIKFLPADITLERSEGTSLLEAARFAGVYVETPCGGSGTCQKCLVKIKGKRKDQSVLICQTAVPDEDIIVEIAGKIGLDFYHTEARRHEGTEFIIEDLVRHLPESGEAFLKTIKLAVASPTLLDGLSDADRFKRAFIKNIECQSIDLPLNVLAMLPEKLREANGEILVYYYNENDIAKIINITSCSLLTSPFSLLPSTSVSSAPPCLRVSSYGISIDIGTTTVSLMLVNIETKKIISVQNAYNSQIECGLDVISRINYAQAAQAASKIISSRTTTEGSPAKKNLNELKTRIIKTINELVQITCKDSGIEPDQILCVSIAGNTVMTHLLLGIVPEYIRLSPYTPAVFQPQIYSAEQVGITVCENAPVLITPAVGSYVGGDITAGLLCTKFAEEPLSNELILFIDIGTNGEIVLGNRDFILACACSAGPAFEGGGIKHGVRACNGAIERISIGEDGEVYVSTIGGEPAIGICGSGIISAIAEMFKKGIIDSAGKILGIIETVKNKEYKICDGQHGDITISEADIDNFIRAKGAIFSACQTMLDSVGMSFKDVNKIYVAGGFGNNLDLEDVRTIGLLPCMSSDTFTFLGNSSCYGAYLSMVSEKYRTKLFEIAGKITYVDLSSELKYMDYYTGSLFLPHTDRTLFE